MTLPHFLKVWSAVEGQLKCRLELILDVQRANWSSEGHLGVQIGSDSAASADCTRKNGAQEASEGCTEPNLAPRRPGWAAQTGVQSPTWTSCTNFGSRQSPRPGTSCQNIRIDMYKFIYIYKNVYVYVYINICF